MATPRTEPVELHEHAMDNLKYIRRTLERAGSFTAVPGKGGVLMGVVAVLAARLAVLHPSAGGWLAVWTVAAVVAICSVKRRTVGIVESGRRTTRSPLQPSQSRKE